MRDYTRVEDKQEGQYKKENVASSFKRVRKYAKRDTNDKQRKTRPSERLQKHWRGGTQTWKKKRKRKKEKGSFLKPDTEISGGGKLFKARKEQKEKMCERMRKMCNESAIEQKLNYGKYTENGASVQGMNEWQDINGRREMKAKVKESEEKNK